MTSISPEYASSLPIFFGKCLRIPQSLVQLFRNQPKHSSHRIELKGEPILQHAQEHLPTSGMLTVDRDGFTYVKLVDEFILDLFSILNNPNTSLPPYFGENLCGAHISVITPAEQRLNIHLSEIGEEIPFTITGCYSAQPLNWSEIERVWFLTVDAPILSEIRSKLGLSPKLDSRDFHITFAIQKRFLSIDDILVAEQANKIILGTGNVTKSNIRFLKNSSKKV